MNVNNAPVVAFNARITPAKLNKYAPSPITIPNFHVVDSTLMRGAKPTEAQLKELKSNGVKSIISFCTNYNPQNPKVKTLPDEANWAQARKKGEKVFIHCRHGADRTGLFSAIYRLRNQNVRLSDVIRELMFYGHDANHNQNIILYIIDFKEKINPNEQFFVTMDNAINNISKFVKDLLGKLFK